MDMDQTHLAGRCPRCGRELPADAPEGLCAACLLAAGADPPSALTATDDPTVLSPLSASGAIGPDGPSLAEGQPFGAYRIGRLLGRGGMGEVYEAEHVESGRRLALKVLRRRLRGADDRARFLREGQLAASVSHPHTVYIFGSEEIAGMPVISMELLPGGTLKDRVAAGGPLPCPEAVAAVLDIVGGLDAAQSAGILHRDIKPSNCFRDQDGTIKVGDFGLSISTLARDVRSAAGPQGFEGTPQFAPPEQLRGEPLDVRADVYAVGATLYYLLTGAPPFEGRDLGELVARVTTDPPVSPRARRPDVPGALAAVVLRCLAKDPHARPASYAELADALRPFSYTDRVPARPGIRTVAGLVDLFVIGLPSSLIHNWTTSVSQTGAQATAEVDFTTGIVAFLYFLLVEGLTGTSLGKRLFGLRVASDAGPVSFGRMAARTLVFTMPVVLPLLLVSGLGRDRVTAYLAAHPALGLASSLLVVVAFAALFSTLRRSNGYAAVHDLVSRTRVIARAAQLERTAAARPPADDIAWKPLTAGTPLRCGPFEVLGDLGESDGGRLLVGFDPVLRRRVWIRAVPTGTPHVSAARRDIGRPGRLHWLAGRRAGGENWDAYELPDGAPLPAREAGDGWPTVKGWLMDLARELAASQRDDSTPRLGLERVWIRHDGHAVLLDFPAPGIPAGDLPASLTPAGLLAAVATRALGRRAPGAPPPSVPLSASALLERWSRGHGADIPADQALRDLSIAIEAPDRVTRRRRAVPIAFGAMPAMMLLGGLLIVIPVFRASATPDAFEVYGLLDALEAADGADGGPANAAERQAIEIYLVGRHREALVDSSFWTSSVVGQEPARLRAIAEGVIASHPGVEPGEVQRAATTLAPRLDRLRQGFETTVTAQVARITAFMVVVFSMLGFGMGLVAGVISALIAPGGLVVRLLGLAVVTRDGVEIGRARSLARAVVAWLPVIAWLAWLGTSPLERALSTPVSPILAAGALLAVMAGGAAWSLAWPERGPVGWLTGTWIRPR